MGLSSVMICAEMTLILWSQGEAMLKKAAALNAATIGAATLGLTMTMFAPSALAEEGAVPTGIPHLDHVFVIMMENHGYSQIVGNENAYFINSLAKANNTAINYYAIAHPSLTNYLEVVGGSNFGVHTDNYPDWHSTTCEPNLATGLVSADNPPSSVICPIAGTGTDAATPAIDYTNQTQGPPGDINIDGTTSIPAKTNVVAKTIGNQLVERGLYWKSYQEDLPLYGPDKVNYSDGFFTNATDFTKITPTLTPPLTQAGIVFLYAVKHNPFAYFADVQEGFDRFNSYGNISPFTGQNGLYADLARNRVAAYSFIAPNQCNDMHGRGNAGPFCNYDPSDKGTQAGLNPALILRGDMSVHRIVDAIRSAPVWLEGKTAIVILWDENDYSTAPEDNRVLLTVVSNFGTHGVVSKVRYTHFSLLKSIEAGFGLPCLNHACDANVNVMSDLFSNQ